MIEFRTASQDDLTLALAWAAQEGWNPGKDDAAAFYAADPKGFFVATENDQPVAAISVVNHNPSFAFLGLYLVLPGHRGQGIGLGLWQHALKHASTRTVGLNGVPDQQANYRSSGFVAAGTTTRYTGPIIANPQDGIRNATASDVSGLIEQEAQASGQLKPAYMKAWFTQTETRKTLIAEGNNGFCTLRKCKFGAKIGPLVAEDTATTRRLIHHAASSGWGDITVDVPETSTELARLCQEHDLQPGFNTARMYRGPCSAAEHPLYAVTTLELG